MDREEGQRGKERKGNEGVKVNEWRIMVMGGTYVDGSPVHDLRFQTLVDELYHTVCYRLSGNIKVSFSAPSRGATQIGDVLKRTFKITVGGIQ